MSKKISSEHGEQGINIISEFQSSRLINKKRKRNQLNDSFPFVLLRKTECAICLFMVPGTNYKKNIHYFSISCKNHANVCIIFINLPFPFTNLECDLHSPSPSVSYGQSSLFVFLWCQAPQKDNLLYETILY